MPTRESRTMEPYSLEQQLLTLSLIAYKGFASLADGQAEQERLAAAVSEALASYEPLGGQWELAWGPGVYRPSLSLFDDVVVYVVRDTSARARPRYAVVVRGTNPISGSDWILGDLWVGHAVGWAWGTPQTGAALSLSSALGLSVVQSLRAPALEPAAFGLDLGELWRGVRGVFEDLDGEALDLVVRGAEQLMAAFERLEGSAERARAELVEATLDRLRSPGLAALDRLIEGLFGRPSLALQFALLQALVRRAERQQEELPGETLACFLRGTTAQAAPEILVTGHSKGGALASVVAQWLADTQGPGIASHERWDPTSSATISCTTFASPSPGNAAFAKLFGERFAGRSLRVANRHDIVTHAWEPVQMREIPELYSAPPVLPLPFCAELVEVLLQRTRAQGYQHVEGKVHEFDFPLADNQATFPTQVAYQHVEAYLHEAGLADVLDRQRLFGLPLVPKDPYL